MAKQGLSLADLAAEITRRAAAKRDLVAPVSKLSMEVVNDAPVLALHNGSVETFPINAIARGQLAEFVGIPKGYFDRMATEAPELCAHSVNRWFEDHRSTRRMVRTLDGTNRAFLSDGYRTLEYEDLAEAALPVLLEKDLLVLSSQITEKRMYIKCVDRSIERDIPIGFALGRGPSTRFDTVSPAIIISDSETGHGRLSVEWGVYTGGCTNLASFGHAFKRAHVGAKMDATDEVYAMLTDETKRKTDAAIWAQVRDVVRGAFDAAQFDATVRKLQAATGVKIEPQAVTEVVERVGRKFAFNEGERKGILARLIEGADLSLYGLHSAITRHSADIEEYDRATELERAGGEVIDLPANAVKELLAA